MCLANGFAGEGWYDSPAGGLCGHVLNLGHFVSGSTSQEGARGVGGCQRVVDDPRPRVDVGAGKVRHECRRLEDRRGVTMMILVCSGSCRHMSGVVAWRRCVASM